MKYNVWQSVCFNNKPTQVSTYNDLATCFKFSGLLGLSKAHVWNISNDPWIFPSCLDINAVTRMKSCMVTAK
jgi:uncharacterized Fe-S cluster protein YjdI